MYVRMNDKTCIDCVYGHYLPEFQLVECGVFDDLMSDADVCDFWSDSYE